MGGTDGRVYGGACDLIHVQDGKRKEAGMRTAGFIDNLMRAQAQGRTEREKEMQSLCPGCYMIVGFNSMVELAHLNKQDLNELADSMIAAYQQLKVCVEQYGQDPDSLCIEEIEVILDKEK